MKPFILILLATCILKGAYGQLSGKLTNENGLPLPSSSVALLRSSDSSVVKITASDETGNYQLQYSGEGKFILHISCIGYESWHSPEFELTTSRPARDFGIQVFKASQQTMEEVSVRANKPLIRQNAYGTIINVESSI